MRIVGAPYERGCKYAILVCLELVYCAYNLSCPTGKDNAQWKPLECQQPNRTLPFPLTFPRTWRMQDNRATWQTLCVWVCEIEGKTFAVSGSVP